MKFTVGWLRDYLDFDASLEALTDKLTALGLEVEDVHDPAEALAPFIVGLVVKAEKHPDADRLQVCQVDTGSEILQVVCGAPNARKGMKGVFAPTGSHIPGTGLDLKPVKIRGVQSNGMLCSEREMELSDAHDGIIELDADAPIGASYAALAGLDDPVIEIAITPNRQDCLGVHGIARDLAAAGMGKLKDTAPKPVKGKFKSSVQVALDFDKEHADACPLFVGRLVRGITNGSSPGWMQRRLKAVGLRPISALVDITNYITFDRGRPLHVYDVGKLTGNVRARMAEKGEKLLALDGETYQLSGTECAIADDSGAIGLGGVMGGESTGCDGNTSEVFVEAALFDPLRTAMTGRRLGIESDARYRFERGVDPAFVVPGMEQATALILEICGGEASDLVIAGEIPGTARSISFNPDRVATLGGLALEASASIDILKRLGFGAKKAKAGSWQVAVPSWRCDIEGQADLVEEVIRVHGYDAIPVVDLPRASAVAKPTLSLAQRRVRAVRRRLAVEGLVECVTWSFMSSEDAKLLGEINVSMLLENPISSELDLMRPTIIPNLLAAAKRNQDRGESTPALFEVGPQYRDRTATGQSTVAAGLRAGPRRARHWAAETRPTDLFDAKADALAALQAAGAPVDKLKVMGDAPDWYHPGRSGTLRLGPKVVLAVYGEIHPKICNAMGLRGAAVGFEVYLDAVPQPRARKTRTRAALEASDLQRVERDFAFVVDRSVTAGDLVSAVRGADKAHIRRVGVFDVFEGEGLEEGKKSIAINVLLEPTERTYTDADIEGIAESIVAAAAKATGARLR
ncbi:MAG: phenylalanine--tRNA ligase subunit beta [Proteobacteria bacterium]|nr:phenylalanine--tRNA ligase subunit beta [Pseudomonadota bacterium]